MTLLNLDSNTHLFNIPCEKSRRTREALLLSSGNALKSLFDLEADLAASHMEHHFYVKEFLKGT